MPRLFEILSYKTAGSLKRGHYLDFYFVTNRVISSFIQRNTYFFKGYLRSKLEIILGLISLLRITQKNFVIADGYKL